MSAIAYFMAIDGALFIERGICRHQASPFSRAAQRRQLDLVVDDSITTHF
jgi:hypothetical protein